MSSKDIPSALESTHESLWQNEYACGIQGQLTTVDELVLNATMLFDAPASLAPLSWPIPNEGCFGVHISDWQVPSPSSTGKLNRLAILSSAWYSFKLGMLSRDPGMQQLVGAERSW